MADKVINLHGIFDTYGKDNQYRENSYYCAMEAWWCYFASSRAVTTKKNIFK